MYKDGQMYWGRLKTDSYDHKLMEWDDQQSKFVLIETNEVYDQSDFIEIEKVATFNAVPDCI